MKPGLVINDRIMVQKVSYWGDDGPDRGEIVVFEDPGGWLDGEQAGPTNNLTKLLAKIGLFPTGGHLVKRVIGVGGDTVECCDADGRLEINGVAIDEDDFIAPQNECDGPMPSGCRKDWAAEVPEGEPVRDGRQPRRVGRLLGEALRGGAATLRPRRGIRAGRPGRGQGVRAGLAARPLPVHQYAGRVRGDPRPVLVPVSPRG